MIALPLPRRRGLYGRDVRCARTGRAETARSIILALALALLPDRAAAVVHARRVDIPRVIGYAVAVDRDTEVDAAEARRVVAQTLADPRSWGHRKKTSFVAVPWRQARLRIRIRTPHNTDRSCAPFKTAGERSCSLNWYVFFNSVRWQDGAVPSGMDVATYRQYMVNHEVGHSLGEPHAACVGVGMVAPVMLQQTIGLDGCSPNPWPDPLAGPNSRTSDRVDSV